MSLQLDELDASALSALKAASPSLTPLQAEAFARVCLRRGLSEPAEVDAFAEADLEGLPAPATLPDIDAASERILAAVDAGEPITVYGDFDADGVTSAACMVLFLSARGARVDAFIPERMKDGRGLSEGPLKRLAARGTRLLITVDHGATATDEVARAGALGMDVVIIDHHRVSDALPAAVAHVNPQRPHNAYPDTRMTAAGLVYLVLRHMDPVGAREVLDLAALGTVCDVGQLKGVNRRIVRAGVERIRRAPRPGIAALAEVIGLDPTHLRARDFAWQLGPRINAAGRLDDASKGLRMLLAATREEARPLAEELEAINLERRRVEAEATEAAIEQVEAGPLREAIVVGDRTWHPGVVGIVANRLRDRYGRPALVLGWTGEAFKGSSRTTPDVDVKAALDACAEHLIRHGGHRAAAGCTVEPEKVAALTAGFIDFVTAHRDPARPSEAPSVDAELPLSELDAAFMEQLERLRPYGRGNYAPRFVARGVTLAPGDCEDGHLRLSATSGLGIAEGFGFNLGHLAPEGPCDLVYTPWRRGEDLVLDVAAVL